MLASSNCVRRLFHSFSLTRSTNTSIPANDCFLANVSRLCGGAAAQELFPFRDRDQPAIRSQQFQAEFEEPIARVG